MCDCERIYFGITPEFAGLTIIGKRVGHELFGLRPYRSQVETNTETTPINNTNSARDQPIHKQHKLRAGGHSKPPTSGRSPSGPAGQDRLLDKVELETICKEERRKDAS